MRRIVLSNFAARPAFDLSRFFEDTVDISECGYQALVSYNQTLAECSDGLKMCETSASASQHFCTIRDDPINTPLQPTVRPSRN